MSQLRNIAKRAQKFNLLGEKVKKKNEKKKKKRRRGGKLKKRGWKRGLKIEKINNRKPKKNIHM